MPVKIFERKIEIEKPAQTAKARLRQFRLLLPALAFVNGTKMVILESGTSRSRAVLRH
jgi:hypothetical protein